MSKHINYVTKCKCRNIAQGWGIKLGYALFIVLAWW